MRHSDSSLAFLGIYTSETINETGSSTFVHKCSIIDVNTLSIGYIEISDDQSLSNFRSLLLQRQPTHAIIFSDDLSSKNTNILEAISAELMLTRCETQTHKIGKNEGSSSNADTIRAFLIQPPLLSVNSPTSSLSNQSHSIFNNEQLHISWDTFNAISTGQHDSYGTSTAVFIAMTNKLLKDFITDPSEATYEQQQNLASSNSKLNQAKLSKMKLREQDLPLQYIFKILEMSSVMRIDSTTLSSLGIVKSPTDTVKSMSLFGLLDNCKTHFGTRLLQQWIKTPLIDIYQINQRQLTVSAFVDHVQQLKDVQTSLHGIVDVEKVLVKLNKYYARVMSEFNQPKSDISSDIIKELLQLHFFVSKVSSIVQTLALLPASPLSPRPADDHRTDGPVYEDDIYTDMTYTTEIDAPNDDEMGKEESTTTTMTTTVKVLSPEKLLQHSTRLDPEQFVNIRYTRQLSLHLQQLVKFQQLIYRSVDLDAIKRQEYLINPDLTDELKSISTRKTQVEKTINRIHREVCSDLNVDQSKIKLGNTSINNIGYYLRVTRKDEQIIRNNSSYRTIDTRKDGVRFTTTSLEKLSADYMLQMKNYNQVQYQICVALLQSAATYFQDFAQIMGIIAELDVLVSFAHVAVTSPPPYIRPNIISPSTGVIIGPPRAAPMFAEDTTISPPASSHIVLKSARHPCLEVQSGVTYIPNDVELIHGKTELQVITGPNMGGKSSYLRTAALVVLMAQLGSFVPCTEASIHIVDCILARVGAGDAQLQGISTFMKEMIETSQILQHSTPNSLILIDELGRGTSTYDGFGLAWGIAEYLATKVHSYTLFATHFHELTAISNIIPTVTNKHVSALTSPNQITMLYQVHDGFCDRSFGIHVAQIASFPDEVITTARQKAAVLEAYGNTSTSDNVFTVDLDEKKDRDMIDARTVDVDLSLLSPAIQQQLIDEILANTNCAATDDDALLTLRNKVVQRVILESNSTGQ